MKIITALLILLAARVCVAQWNQAEGIYTPYVYTLHFYGNNIYAGTLDSMYISNDLGKNWRSINFMNTKPATVTSVFVKDNVIYAGTYEEGVFTSSDNGNTWQQYNNGLGGWSLYVTFLYNAGDTLFAGTDGNGIYYNILTENNQWHAFNDSLPMNVASTANAFCKTSASYLYSGGGSGFYFVRSNNDTYWTDKTLAPEGTGTPRVFLNVNDTVFTGTRFGIYRSLDYGYTWKYSGISALNLQVLDLKYYNGRIYAALGRTNEFWVWYSTDMGNTWTFLDHQFATLNKFEINNDIIWAATNSGIWYSNPVTAVNNQKKITDDYRLHQNYPNPFNPETEITFSLPVQDLVTIKVYDLLGREIVTLLNEERTAGEHKVKFHASSFSGGIYLYRIQAGAYTETKKMIFLK